MAEQMSVMELLVQLHRYHRQLAELNHRLKRGLQIIELHKSKLTQFLESLKSIQQEQTELFLEAKNLEKQLQRNEDSLKRRRGQMSEAKSNKELQALKMQLDADEEINSRLADEALAAMDRAEEVTPKLAAAQKAVDEIKKTIENAEKDYNEEKPSILADIEKYQARLTLAEEDLPIPFEGPYRRLVEKLGGDHALCPVVNEVYCGNCNQQIPIHFVTEICNGKPFTCQSCGRLLYVPEGFELH